MRELRGVPIAGRGLSSAMPGTMPLPAVIAKDERGKLFPRPSDPVPVGEEILVVHYPRSRRSVLHLGVYR
jgi:hypothetical protein